MTARMCIACAAVAAGLLVGVVPSSVQARHQTSPQSPPANPTAPAGPSTPAPAGNAESGRQAFVKKGCYACHGREGQGSPTTGPRLGPNPSSLAAFTRYVRSPRAQMPPYTEKVVSDSELADMHAFLQARPRPGSIDTLLPR